MGKLDNPKTLYRGVDCVKRFIKDIKEKVRYLIEEIPSVEKMIPLTVEEENNHKKAQQCNSSAIRFVDTLPHFLIRVYSWKCGADGCCRQMWQVSCRRQGMLTQGPAPDPKSKV